MSRSMLEKMTGASEYVHVDGTRYQLSPITPEDFADVRAVMRSQVEDPLDQMLVKIESGKIPKHLHELAFKEALRQQEAAYSFSSVRGREWTSSSAGMAAFLWVTIRRKHPEVSYDDALAMIRSLNVAIAEELMKKIDSVSGFGTKETSANPTSPKQNLKRARAPKSHKVK